MRAALVSGIRFVAYACLAFALACSQRAPASHAEPATPAAPPSVPPGAWLDAGRFVDESPTPARVEVILIDAGAAPRAPLRYPEASARRVERRLRASLHQDVSPEGAPTLSVATSPWTMAIGMTRDSTWRYDLGAIQALPGPASDAVLFRRVFGKWTPAQGELAVDARGFRAEGTPSVFYQHATDSSTELLKLLDDVFDAWTPVFPEEPVGVGARWRVVDTLRRGGLTLARTATFTLVGRGRVRGEIQIDTPRPQRIHVISEGSVFTFGLAYWKVDLRSDVTLDPTSLLPRRASATHKLVFQTQARDETRAADRPSTVVLSAELR